MKQTKRTRAGDALTDLILDLFRLNNLLLTAGDRLVAGLGLTSARWQILGAIVAAERSQPVAWLARDLGANRQNVQRIVNDLEKEGLVAFETEPASPAGATRRADRQGKADLRCRLAFAGSLGQRLSDDLAIKDIETPTASSWRCARSWMATKRRRRAANPPLTHLCRAAP